MADPFNLQRFVVAQDAGGSYGNAVMELSAGRKVSHWMWFVFPQIAGLGHSAMARRYEISSLREATAYLEHPTLGPRLIHCSGILAATTGRSAEQILGCIDAQKLRSSMTLFHQAGLSEAGFQQVLDGYFDGQPDPATLRLLKTVAPNQ
jgi:uncharacterized protein (DUF1810 family)